MSFCWKLSFCDFCCHKNVFTHISEAGLAITKKKSAAPQLFVNILDTQSDRYVPLPRCAAQLTALDINKVLNAIKSRIPETKHLSTVADSNTDTKKILLVS